MARIIPKRTLEDIRFRNDIADVIGSYFNLQRAGSAFKALCPFHKEKTPSFHVNPQRQIFHCFGCGAGGDVFRFVMMYEGLDFVSAAKMLAERAGVVLELEEGEDGDVAEKQALYKIHEELAQFYRRCLLQMKAAQVARDYLEKRDLPDETIEKFLIGYAPDRWDAALKWAHKHKHSVQRLEAAGLIVKTSKPSARSDFYDRFRNRLMFPIRDEQNRVIGFSGRSLGDQDKTAKYINSPETPLFRKGRVLYALEKARRPIVDSREALVCEGQIDVIRCHSAGFETAVAPQGTAVTEDHARILRRYADSVCIVFDPDRAGRDASIRAAETFMDVGLAVRVASLPEGEDPDSLVLKQGADAFRAVIENAESAVGFQIRVLSSREDAKSEAGLMRTAKAVLATISHSPNAVQKAKLLQEAGERLDLPVKALTDDLQYMIRTAATYERNAAQPQVPTSEQQGARAKPAEDVALCEHMVHVGECPEVADLARQYLRLEMITDPDCRAVVRAALESAESGRPVQDILHGEDGANETLERFAACVQMAPRKTGGQEFSSRDAVTGLILAIWRRALRREREALGAEEPERRSQITCDLNRLKTWEQGASTIEIELSLAE